LEELVHVIAGLTGTVVAALLMLPFSGGENVVFSIFYGPIPAGIGSLTLSMDSLDGDSLYHASWSMRTNRFFSFFYKIDDKIDSFFTGDSLLSVEFSKSIKEGSHEEKASCHFFYEEGMAVYSDGDTVELIPNSRDYLTTLYYVRNMDLAENSETTLVHHTGKKNTELMVKVVGREMVETSVDDFECLVVDLVSESGGIFARGPLRIWLADDEARVPVQLKAKTAIGAITGVLRELELGRDSE
jgi:hypothetical protein